MRSRLCFCPRRRACCAVPGVTRAAFQRCTGRQGVRPNAALRCANSERHARAALLNVLYQIFPCMVTSPGTLQPGGKKKKLVRL